MKTDDKSGFDTIALHGGYDPDTSVSYGLGDGAPRGVPVYRTTPFVFRDTEHARKLFALEEQVRVLTAWHFMLIDIAGSGLLARFERCIKTSAFFPVFVECLNIRQVQTSVEIRALSRGDDGTDGWLGSRTLSFKEKYKKSKNTERE